MFQILWQFDATDEQVDAFAEAYGPTGPWATFFRQAPGPRPPTCSAGLKRPPAS